MTGLPVSPSHGKLVLHAGELYFGDKPLFIHTLLGSCISITLWHPERGLSGMCHFACPRYRKAETALLDPRYAEDCLALFKKHIKARRSELGEYEVKIFGGGNMTGSLEASSIIVNAQPALGDKNAEIAMQMLMHEGADIKVVHVGEFGYRRIVFDTVTGDVWVKFHARKDEKDRLDSQRGYF